MRKPIVAGNWKMNGGKAQVAELVTGISPYNKNDVEVIVFPPFIYLSVVSEDLNGSAVALGAQTVSEHQQGAYTGEISASMLLEVGCRYVLVGHSERRHIYGESNQQVADKFATASSAGLVPVLCVGETLEQREAGQTMAIITAQIEAVLGLTDGIQMLKNAVIAYEPVWAIGTGKTASPEQAQEVHADIRALVARHDETVAKGLRILYGGSVKAANAGGLFAKPDIDGGLVGGASLQAQEFLAIVGSWNN